MKCPYCSSEMKKGYIPAARDFLEWVPKGEEPSMIFFRKGDGRIKLTETPFFNMESIEGFVCSSCKKLIIDYDE